MNEAFRFRFDVEAKGKTPGLMHQVHGALLVECDLTRRDRDADGVYSRKTDEPVFVFTADCLPVLFASDHLVAAVHAGWRGAKQGIVGKMLASYSELGETPRIILGPCLKACCFEVKEDFIAEFSAARGSIDRYLVNRGSSRYFDLVAFVLEKELGGVASDQIDLSPNRCTFCSAPELPSYRRNKGTDPRIRASIQRIIPPR